MHLSLYFFLDDLSCGSAPLRFSVEAGQRHFLRRQSPGCMGCLSLSEALCRLGFSGVSHLLAHGLYDFLSTIGIMFSETTVHITPDQENRWCAFRK